MFLVSRGNFDTNLSFTDKFWTGSSPGGHYCFYQHHRIFFLLHLQLTSFQTKICSQQVLIYLDVPGISVKEPLQNSWMYEVKVNCASFLTGRHLLLNKKDKNSRYTKYKNNDN